VIHIVVYSVRTDFANNVAVASLQVKSNGDENGGLARVEVCDELVTPEDGFVVLRSRSAFGNITYPLRCVTETWNATVGADDVATEDEPRQAEARKDLELVLEPRARRRFEPADVLSRNL